MEIAEILFVWLMAIAIIIEAFELFTRAEKDDKYYYDDND